MKMWRSERGSAEVVAFVLILPLLMLPIANSIYMVADLAVYNKIMTQARRTMLAMESQGGMTAPLQQSLETALQADGIDISKLNIAASPAPVSYGSDVTLEMTYQRPLVRFTLQGIILKKKVDPAGMRFGPLKGISKRFER